MAGLQIFARLPEGKIVDLTLSPEARVSHLMDEVRRAARMRSAPKIRFLEEELKPSMLLADTGITPEAVVEVAAVGIERVPIAAAPSHWLAVMGEDTRIQAWGDNDCNQCTIPDLGGVRVLQVAGGACHSMALMEDNTVRAWGLNDDDECTIPDFEGLGVVQIGAGVSTSILLMDDHTVRVWGCNMGGKCDVPDFAGKKVLQIAAGWSHSMALMEDHTVRGWGYNGNGQS
eukprot:Hpha_TRINITY_DN16671_c2_g1::TRINITY_DN16671_c2_g1_i1::g.183318::m.183318